MKKKVNLSLSFLLKLEHQKAKRLKVCKQNQNLPNDWGYLFISKIVSNDQAFIPFHQISTYPESKICVLEDICKLTIMKKQ